MNLYLSACFDIWLELAPWLLVGMAAAGLLHVFAPAEWIKNHLGGSGVSSIGKAVLIGTPMPLCSCGVIPAALGLRKDGASKGASLAFLISTPQTGVDSISVSAAFLGLPFALFKVFSAVLTGLVGGWIAERVDPDANVPLDPIAPSALSNKQGITGASGTLAGTKRGWRDGVAHADTLLQMIGFWLVVGVLASALITVTVGPDALATWQWTQGITGMIVMLVISLPLYVCATSSVPIAAALVAAGLPAGAALVFLMAGPASNVATIGAVYKAFGKRLTVVYLATVTVGSIGLGLIFEQFWGITVSEATTHAHHHGRSWIAIAAGVILALMLLRHFVRKAFARLRTGASATEMRLTVTGMSCGGCAAKLERFITAVPNVTSAKADAGADSLVIQGSPDPAAITQAIADAGFKFQGK